jgi:hypothetical protein
LTVRLFYEPRKTGILAKSAHFKNPASEQTLLSIQEIQIVDMLSPNGRVGSPGGVLGPAGYGNGSAGVNAAL